MELILVKRTLSIFKVIFVFAWPVANYKPNKLKFYCWMVLKKPISIKIPHRFLKQALIKAGIFKVDLSRKLLLKKISTVISQTSNVRCSCNE